MGTYAMQQVDIPANVALAEGVLETERQDRHAGVAVRQSQEPSAESILRVVRVCVFMKGTGPLIPRSRKLVVRSRSDLRNVQVLHPNEYKSMASMQHGNTPC